MKNLKTILSLLIVILTLCSCSNEKSDPSPQSTTQSNTDTQTSTIISYYISEIERLEETILSIKEEHYIETNQYINQINKLTEQLQSQGTLDPSDTEDISSLPFSYNLNGDKATIVKYTGSSANVTVPEKIQGYPVFKIGEFAFDSGIQSIIISEGIQEIDWFAFSGCTRLTEIYIPISVTLINYGAFDYCPKSLVIKCKKGSYAEAYAKSYGFNCIAE